MVWSERGTDCRTVGLEDLLGANAEYGVFWNVRLEVLFPKTFCRILRELSCIDIHCSASGRLHRPYSQCALPAAVLPNTQ